MEELRSEMLEMRDMYMEDDVYQLQELRQQLEQVRRQANALPAHISDPSGTELGCVTTGAENSLSPEIKATLGFLRYYSALIFSCCFCFARQIKPAASCSTDSGRQSGDLSEWHKRDKWTESSYEHWSKTSK